MHRRTLQITGFTLLAGLAWTPAACSGSDTGSSGGSAAAGSSQTSAGTGGKTSPSGGTKADAGTSNNAGSPEGGSSAPAEAGAAGAPLGLGGAGGSGAEAGSPDPGAGGAVGECEAVAAQHALAPGIHVTACTPIDYATNPPSSGEHYPNWADFGVYDFPLPRGFWMHNLEHGAVVVTYSCGASCAADLAAAKAWLAGLSADATCPSGPPRVLLVPDPKLDVAWAASAWGFTLRAKCFDAAAFTDFVTAHAGGALAPEAGICSTGVDFRMDGVDTCGAK
jgi:hypothetical protein